MNSLARYLSEVRKIRSLGSVPETSYYPPLSELLNTIGLSLSPKVRCVVHPKSQGAGIPDLALFSVDQIPTNGEPLPGVIPSRGVIEAKGTGDNVDKIAASKQVEKYLERYGQVLVTNLREFLLVTKDGPKERFKLAESETEFWSGAGSPDHVAFADFLKRVLLSNAPLVEPKDVAWLLASYAREARARIIGSKLEALEQLRAALEETLGITFTGEKGDNFFRSTLVQTLFYGVFSAWVLWCQRNPKGNFDWRLASYELRVPMIRALFYQAADPSRLEPLGLVEILDWAGEALGRVDREAFFTRFAAENAVQYFYEPFLEAFDPELRKELGVWYTPREIVRYQVERVDTALREELGVAAGLADPNVVVLDPCCGTGAYLVEVLRVIHDRLTDGGADMLALSDVRKAAVERVFGFEILPAPFVVAHLQLGLLLQTMGASLSASTNERVGVYLTNALTGWNGEPPQIAMMFPELNAERDAAGKVKRESKILVILGNPPYNAFSGVAPKEEAGMVDPYKAGLNTTWGIKKFNLDDLYVRFFRLAERRIVEGEPGRGVLCFISNFSYLADPSFVVMRKRLLDGFDSFWFDSLNGDSRETGKKTPDGLPDPSAFSTPYNREGIRVGTAIGLMVRKEKREEIPTVRYREFWGAAKRDELLQSLKSEDPNAEYQVFAPSPENRFSFRSAGAGELYQSWPKLSELWEVASNGLMEKRGGALMSNDRNVLEARMKSYYDSGVTWESLAALGTGLTRDAAGFDAKKIRTKVQGAESFQPDRLRRYSLRPLETIWAYHSSVSPLWNRSRPDLWAQCWEGNKFLLTRFQASASSEGPPFYFTSCLSDDHCLQPDAVAVPLRIRSAGGLFGADDTSKANLSATARAYLAGLGVSDPDADEETASLLWYHALAIGFSPAYLAENADGIRGDFPRVPLPKTKELLRASASLGKQIAALLDTETPVPGVTEPPTRDDLKTIALLVHSDRPDLQDGDLAVTAGWGNATKTGVMPGRGKLEENPGGTLNVYLNEKVAWRGIPPEVWRFTLGGYQVMKKWLSYREESVLGRPLTSGEAREFQQMARRIASTIRISSSLNINYENSK